MSRSTEPRKRGATPGRKAATPATNESDARVDALRAQVKAVDTMSLAEIASRFGGATLPAKGTRKPRK